MDDLRQRFASLDRVPVPDLWSDVEHRLEALATTVPTGRPVGPGLAWRGSGDREAPRRAGRPVSRAHQLPLVAWAALMTLVLLGVAVAVGTGLVRLPAVVPPSTPSSPDRKSTRLNSSHLVISYAVFCLKKKKNNSAEKMFHFRRALQPYTNR